MKNTLYFRIVPKGREQPAGTLVGACVTEEVNGYAVWRIKAEGDYEDFYYDLVQFPLTFKEDAIEQAVGIYHGITLPMQAPPP